MAPMSITHSHIIQQIREVAAVEHAAEETRENAQAQWREAWWNTTLVLAAVEDDRRTLNVAYTEAMGNLGVTRSYLSTRRRVGKKLLSIGPERLRTLPPRLALAWVVDCRREADGAYEALREAQEHETSLRDFIKQHGGTPMSTGKERFRNTDGVTPSQREQIVLEMLTDPETAMALMRDPQIRLAISRAQKAEHKEILDRSKMTRTEDEQRDRDSNDYLEAEKQLGESRRRAALALDTLLKREEPLSDDEKSNLLESIENVRETLAWVESRVISGDASFEDQLATLLKGE
jgi:hypothetical protein